MSDIQELIHKTSMDCIEKGQRMEQERIIKLLEAKADEPCCCFTGTYGEHELPDLIALIKGEK